MDLNKNTIVPKSFRMIMMLDLCRVEPDVGVDNDDVSRIQSCLNLSMARHPTLRRRAKFPGLNAS